jgi:flagellar biosynthesis anti-sigma factor FlgM
MSSIDRVNISNPSLDPTYAVQGEDQVRVSQNGHSSAKNDSVALSSTAREIDRLSAIVGQSREDRIEQVREMLNAGTYKVSSQDIARKMIESNWK